jgi:hypothetical protein
MGRAFFQIAGVFAELERGMIESRTKAGIEKARLDLIKTVDFNYHDIFRLFTDLNRLHNLDVD